MSFSQNFKNKTFQPIGSSPSGDILIITKFDLCFKMTKKRVFQSGFPKHDEKRVFRHFKAQIKLCDHQNVTRS